MTAQTLLKLGDRGPEVVRLQRLLNAAIIPPPGLRADGDFGKKTEAALKLFQLMSGVVPDGVVGVRTWSALGIKQHAPEIPNPAKTAANKSKCDWMEIAEEEIGTHEISLPGQHTKRIVEYHSATSLAATTDEVPWCSSFVNWVMKEAGYKGTGSAAAKSWLSWGGELANPKKGAIVVIRQKSAGADSATGSATGFHVAFFVSETATHIRLLGGNQGDSVKYSNFALKSYEVKAYRWPS